MQRLSDEHADQRREDERRAEEDEPGGPPLAIEVHAGAGRCHQALEYAHVRDIGIARERFKWPR